MAGRRSFNGRRGSGGRRYLGCQRCHGDLEVPESLESPLDQIICGRENCKLLKRSIVEILKPNMVTVVINHHCTPDSTFHQPIAAVEVPGESPTRAELPAGKVILPLWSGKVERLPVIQEAAPLVSTLKKPFQTSRRIY
jgi:hypothetical protein